MPRLRPLLWVPSLYLAMGIPFNVIIGGTAVRMYKSLGYTDSAITVALGSIGVAWSLKPLWAAFLDMYRTKKFFVIAMELLIAALFVSVALELPTPAFMQASIALFWIMAFASSTQDICADGIYLTALSKPDQARLAGVQGTFWVLGKVLATGILISVMDRARAANQWTSYRMWSMVMAVCAAAMTIFGAWHWLALPESGASRRPSSAKEIVRDFVSSAGSFFHKRQFWGMIAFVFLFRFGEGLILMEGQLFLQSSTSVGGLGMTAGQVSNIDAVWGTIFSILGGLLGGAFVSTRGLPRSLLIMALCLNVPHLTYVYLSHFASAGHGVDYGTIATMVSIEKFGYGFGFAGNMIYMMQQLAPGRCTMTHYAFGTALMNLVFVPTNMVSGPLAEWLGFSRFFLVVMAASVPSILAAWKAPFPLALDEGTEITVDDPTRLCPAERQAQLHAGRSSIFAMLNILAILLFDSRILGAFQGRTHHPELLLLVMLAGNFMLKLFLTIRCLRAARECDVKYPSVEEEVYIANASGAKMATWICGIVSVGVMALGIKLSF